MLAGKNHGLFVFFPLSQADQPLPVSKKDVKRHGKTKQHGHCARGFFVGQGMLRRVLSCHPLVLTMCMYNYVHHLVI